ncbi:hypothetical protein, partial [Escherichia coli]|uniref:hypothetical protein n=1 Tax=Escherichia coli TaxID=562 RepID=UPI003F29CF2F
HVFCSESLAPHFINQQRALRNRTRHREQTASQVFTDSSCPGLSRASTFFVACKRASHTPSRTITVGVVGSASRDIRNERSLRRSI